MGAARKHAGYIRRSSTQGERSQLGTDSSTCWAVGSHYQADALPGCCCVYSQYHSMFISDRVFSGMELEREVKKPCLSPGHAALPRQCSTLKPEAPACLSFSLGTREEREDRGPSPHDYSA